MQDHSELDFERPNFVDVIKNSDWPEQASAMDARSRRRAGGAPGAAGGQLSLIAGQKSTAGLCRSTR